MESVLKKKKNPIVCCLQVIHFKYKDSKIQGWRLILKDSCEHACQGAILKAGTLKDLLGVGKDQRVTYPHTDDQKLSFLSAGDLQVLLE